MNSNSEGRRKLTFLSDRIHRYGIYTIILFQIAGLVTILLNYFKLPPVIPLFYYRQWGILQLGEPKDLFILTATSLVISIFNIFLASKLFSETALLSRVLVWSAVLIAVLSSITIIRIIFLII
jgi:hypothetical protein